MQIMKNMIAKNIIGKDQITFQSKNTLLEKK